MQFGRVLGRTCCSNSESATFEEPTFLLLQTVRLVVLRQTGWEVSGINHL